MVNDCNVSVMCKPPCTLSRHLGSIVRMWKAGFNPSQRGDMKSGEMSARNDATPQLLGRVDQRNSEQRIEAPTRQGTYQRDKTPDTYLCKSSPRPHEPNLTGNQNVLVWHTWGTVTWNGLLQSEAGVDHRRCEPKLLCHCVVNKLAMLHLRKKKNKQTEKNN